MIIRPELEALRGDDAPQRRAQAAVRAIYEDWRASSGRQVEEELAAFTVGAELEDLPLLATLFAADDDAAARVFVAGLLDPLLVRLAREPLTQSPLRYVSGDLVTSISLARHATTTLTLLAVDGIRLARRPKPASISFAPAEIWERVLTGTAAATRVRVRALRPEGANLEFSEFTLALGDVCHRLGEREAQLLREAPTGLVTLKLQRRVGVGTVVREHLLSDGRLIHQAAGSPRESRLELTAALLGRMGRRDAAPLLAAMAEEDGGHSLRWQALRECLALDTAGGFATLCRLSQRSDDALAAPAGALHAQLLDTYPELAGACPCPA